MARTATPVYWLSAVSLLAAAATACTAQEQYPKPLIHTPTGVFRTSPGDAVLASHGGTLDEDTHVVLLVSAAQFTGRSDPTYVPTTQLGPLLLRALGMERFDLDALHKEHSPALPGVF